MKDKIPLDPGDEIVGIAGTDGYRYSVVTKFGYVYQLICLADDKLKLIKSELVLDEAHS